MYSSSLLSFIYFFRFIIFFTKPLIKLFFFSPSLLLSLPFETQFQLIFYILFTFENTL